MAQNILDLIPTLNQCFLTNMTSNMVYNGIWLAQGDVPGSNCASQSLLVDVAPALNLRTLPNVTQWAQVALLWNLVESQDIEATTELQDFIQKAPWNLFGRSAQPLFAVLASGYIFNFATQEVTPPNVPFVSQSQLPSAQLAQVGPVAHSALDRMYSFAVGKAIFSRHATPLTSPSSFVNTTPKGLGKLLDRCSAAAARRSPGLHVSPQRFPYLTSFRCYSVTTNGCKPSDSSCSFIFSTSSGMLPWAQLGSEAANQLDRRSSIWAHSVARYCPIRTKLLPGQTGVRRFGYTAPTTTVHRF